MGLDMYAYKTSATITDADFPTPETREISTWRKHPNLHGWMEQLYRRKGGSAPEFNCVNVQLEPADIDALGADILAGRLPVTTGFFFGTSLPGEEVHDLAFIEAARESFEEGYAVFYNAWW